MVSDYRDRSSSLTRRGPASAVGVIGPAPTASASVSSPARQVGPSARSRRYGRSHAGGTSYIPQNEFPIFSHSGDVEITVRAPGGSGHENRYLLHRHTLTRCSGFFEASTSNEWSRAEALPELPAPPSGGTLPAATTTGRDSQMEIAPLRTTTIGDGGRSSSSSIDLSKTGSAPRKMWRYELDPGADGDDIPMLVQKDDSELVSALSGSIFGGGPMHNTATVASASASASAAVPRRSSSKGSTPATHSNNSFFRSVANLSMIPGSSYHGHHHPQQQPQQYPAALPPMSPEDEDLLRDYDNLFRIMYNYSPVLDGINIADAYVQCKSLLTLADQYDALAVVGPRVDHHMLQFQSRLWKQIAKYPISYLRLGYLARSRIIFQEALIHVVGQWPAGERSLRAALPDAVLDLIEDKVDELDEAVARAEGRLFRLGLTTRSGDRVTPATSYLDWLAVSLFRQWLADNMTPPPPPPLPPDRGHHSRPPNSSRDAADRYHHHSPHQRQPSSTAAAAGSSSSSAALVPATGAPPAVPSVSALGRTFRTLGGVSSSSTPSYLGHDECKRFLKLTPELYSRDNLRRFEKRLDELKAIARDLVRPLMGSGLELDLAGGGSGAGGRAGAGADGIAYLTCTHVGDRDLPWPAD